MSHAQPAISSVHAFAERAWDQYLELHPLWATAQGDERWDDRLDDPGPAGRDALQLLVEGWEAEMAGPIHNKGVLTLTGYLGGQYAGEIPLSFSAQITFEQTYSGVEGDTVITGLFITCCMVMSLRRMLYLTM